jgi:glycosyltransferase involved in cell wall biosynthesis
LKQSYTNYEFLILDDCSTDESWHYLDSIKNKNVTLYRNEKNKGLFYNLNFLIKESKGSLIKLWAQDDIMYPHCLESFVLFFEQYPQVGFAYSGIHNIDEAGNIKQQDYTDTTPQIISTELHARIAFFTGSIAGNIANVCINRTALQKVGLFNEQMKISADFDMWVRLAKDHDTGFIAEILVQLRDHTGQLSRNESLYIHHVREDLQVYGYLNSYVSKELKDEGKKIMRNHKLVFYYTLMVKSFFKGNITMAFSFFKELNHYDNFLKLSSAFLRIKITKSANSIFNKKLKSILLLNRF